MAHLKSRNGESNRDMDAGEVYSILSIRRAHEAFSTYQKTLQVVVWPPMFLSSWKTVLCL